MSLELTDEHIRRVLAAYLHAEGAQLRGWRLRSVHRRGRSSTSVLVEGDTTDATRRRRTLLYVLHTSRRDVPDGAAVLDVEGVDVHVWQFPDDPYLPGLRAAVSRSRAQDRLDHLAIAPGDGGRVGIHTRSYRPTRRAVIELTPSGEASPALYLKVLGGRRADDVRARTVALVDLHDHFVDDLPVPRALEHDPTTGTVALEPMAGDTLRRRLRTGRPLPPVADVAALVERIGRAPSPPGDTDPARYADVTRHVELLSSTLPRHTDDLATVAGAVAGLGGPRGTVHGDLHDGQLLVHDGAVTGLLDIDGAGTGLLAHDAGRLVANIEVAALSAPDQAIAVEHYARTLAELLVDTVPAADLALAAAAAWIGLATGPNRVRGSGWRAATADRIARAVAWTERR